MFKIKFPTKRIFRIFHILKLMEWRRFVTYLWNDPRILLIYLLTGQHTEG